MKYYINYVEGSPAFVSQSPCNSLKSQINSDDPNVLSQIVCKFNDHQKVRVAATNYFGLPSYSYEDHCLYLNSIASTLL